MNSIFSNYGNIDELELNKRISFYEHSEFSTEAIELLIPDVVPYVQKIFNCIRWATQNREIIEDICHQIVDARNARSQLIQSVAYNVGSLQLDGRAYAQQNIHQYCRYISETNDCLCQILNIVFCIGKRPWDRFEMDKIKSHVKLKKHSHILTLWSRYYDVIKTHKSFDNFDKHNLILWGHEKLTPQSISSVEYYFYKGNHQIKMSEWINSDLERKIKVAIVEFLDNIFSLASPKHNPNRKYVHMLFDVLLPDGQLPMYSSRFLAKDNIMQLRVETKAKDDCTVIASISYTHNNTDIPTELFLARLDQEIIENNIIQSNLGKLSMDSFDVFVDGKLTGKYKCTSAKDKNTKYFHFVKYSFIPNRS